MTTSLTNAPERLRLKITLEGSKPAIWRRVEVDENLTFLELHDVIQVAMGWRDDHLHEFQVGKQRVSLPSLEDAMFGDPELTSPEDSTTLSQFLSGQRQFRYWYDFGDDWWHRILIEKRLPSDPSAPLAVLVAGERACPPEDSGGVYGYADLLAAFNDPVADDFEQARDWLGDDFDPSYFDFEAHAGRVAAIVKARRQPRLSRGSSRSRN